MFPQLSKAYSSNMNRVDATEDCQKLYKGSGDEDSASILVSGHRDGKVRFYMNGFLFCAAVDMAKIVAGGGEGTCRVQVKV